MSGSGTYTQPYRPRPVAWMNAAGGTLRKMGRAPAKLSARELMQTARRKARLDDYGDESFLEPLERLTFALEREAQLTTVGRMITRGRLVGTLCTRLRVQSLLNDHPEILRRELEPPVVIAGLQRTGTTMLHRLLASDPSLRSLASWEALAPLPARGLKPGETDPRIRMAKLSERGLAYLAPDFFAIHPVEADAPEEDVLLLDFAFLSTVPEATLRVPSYAAWLETVDNTPAYEYMRTLLKVLSYQRGGDKRWLLKTPHHLEYLDVLRKVFPDAAIIQTHRDPARTLASFCSMIAHGRGVFSDHVDPNEVGRDWSRKVARLVDKAMQYRQSVDDAGFVDVSYYDLIEDPLREAKRVYDAVGLPWSNEVERAMGQTRSKNPQNKYGRHRYELADFGLRREGVEPLFAAYRERFDIRHEG